MTDYQRVQTILQGYQEQYENIEAFGKADHAKTHPYPFGVAYTKMQQQLSEAQHQIGLLNQQQTQLNHKIEENLVQAQKQLEANESLSAEQLDYKQRLENSQEKAIHFQNHIYELEKALATSRAESEKAQSKLKKIVHAYKTLIN